MSTHIVWRESADSATFRYIPAAPGAECAPGGAPTLALWLTGGQARLHLGAQWTLSHDERETLLRELAAQYSRLQPAEIDLQPAPAQVEKVQLLVGDGRGDWSALASSPSSGYVPYTALFALPLSESQQHAALAALNGRRGYLAVRYYARVLRENGAWERVERGADVADWFRGRRGSDHVHVIPVGDSAPGRSMAEPPSTMIRLDDALKSAPIAFIRIESGAQQVLLRAPAFDAVTLPHSPQPLRCVTHYTIGPPAYGVEIEPQTVPAMGILDSHSGHEKESRVVLSAAEVGVALVRLSAPGPRAGKAREVRVTARYLPGGEGAPDERMIYLRGEQWESQWWVVSRAATLNGAIEISAKITRADGQSEILPRKRYESGDIVFDNSR